MMMAQSEYLTSRQCARLIGWTDDSLRQSRSKNATKLRLTKAPPYIKTPTGLIRYKRADVVLWMKTSGYIKGFK